MVPFKCSNRFKIVLDHLRLSFNAVNTLSFTNIINMQVEQCVLMHVFFKNNQGVRLLEHVR